MTRAWGGLGQHIFHKRTEIASELHGLVQAGFVFPGAGQGGSCQPGLCDTAGHLGAWCQL